MHTSAAEAWALACTATRALHVCPFETPSSCDCASAQALRALSDAAEAISVAVEALAKPYARSDNALRARAAVSDALSVALRSLQDPSDAIRRRDESRVSATSTVTDDGDDLSSAAPAVITATSVAPATTPLSTSAVALESQQRSAPLSPPPPELPARVVANFGFEGVSACELSLRQGDVVEVLGADASGWWRGRCRSKEGFFPSNYCRPTTASEDARYLRRRHARRLRRSDENISRPLPNPARSLELDSFAPPTVRAQVTRPAHLRAHSSASCL